MENQQQTLAALREYYGKILAGSKDLKTNACCSVESLPPHYRGIPALLDDEIIEKFYGCGSPIPPQKLFCQRRKAA